MLHLILLVFLGFGDLQSHVQTEEEDVASLSLLGICASLGPVVARKAPFTLN